MAGYWDIVTNEALDAGDLEERYRQSLNDIYGEICIAGIEFDTDHALEKLDPIAFRVGLNDWIDAELGESITDVEPVCEVCEEPSCGGLC